MVIFRIHPRAGVDAPHLTGTVPHTRFIERLSLIGALVSRAVNHALSNEDIKKLKEIFGKDLG
jgi:hypothetical protein